MTHELELELQKKYPELFQDCGKSPQETCMAFWTEHGDGWFKILDDLCGYLSSLSRCKMWLKTHSKSDDASRNYIEVKRPGIKFAQIKEKFGTLCVYWDQIPLENREYIESQLEDVKDLEKDLRRYYDNIHSVVEYAEYLSSKTCEQCGKPGKIGGKGWIRTECEECKNARNEKIA